MDLFALKSLLLLLSFIGFGAGRKILPDGPVDGVLGRNVTLTTLIDQITKEAIIWNFNHEGISTNVATSTIQTLNVNDPYQGRAFINRTNGYLTLSHLKSEDSGDYGISVLTLSTGTTETAEIELRVLEPVSDVAIKSDLPEAIEFNSSVVLTCSAKGSFLTFTWTNGSVPIEADGKRLVVKNEELLSTLTINEVRRTDLVGPIYCTAANKLEKERSAPFNLTVYYGPDEATIAPTPPPAVQSGSNLSLTCSAQSSPAAAFSWFYGENLIVSDTPVLTLGEIERQLLGKEMGQYGCVASNGKTKRFVSAKPVSFIVMEPVSGVTVTGPTGVLVAGNGSANISCKAAAGSVKATAWTKDGQALTASARLAFAADLSSMRINTVQKEDNGEYTCQLSNPVNKEQASYKMVVNYGPEPATVLGNAAIEVNDQLKLVCSADSVPPANYTWKFNGTLTGVKTATYTIDRAVFSNSGTYTCEAHNSVTGKNSTFVHTLTVKDEGELDGLSDGAIAGIVIGVLGTLGLAVGLIVYCRQKVPVESPY